MGEEHWQLEGSAAELYQRYLVPGITSKWAEDLVHRAQLRSGEEVLDVACGTGVVARLAAKKMGSGHVTGLDLNAGMLAVARDVSGDGPLVNWMEGSALDLPFPSGHFDAVLCQLGLQFFPDQSKALREMRRVVRMSGRVALSVYSPIERTPGANAFVGALDDVLGPQASRIKRANIPLQPLRSSRSLCSMLALIWSKCTLLCRQSYFHRCSIMYGFNFLRPR
jgi:ubiquinone/menaquinone biosynthesis C-methylase UbiE